MVVFNFSIYRVILVFFCSVHLFFGTIQCSSFVFLIQSAECQGIWKYPIGTTRRIEHLCFCCLGLSVGGQRAADLSRVAYEGEANEM